MYISNSYKIYNKVGDFITVFSKSDHLLKYIIDDISSTSYNASYTRDYILKSGKTFYYYLVFSEWGQDYFEYIDNYIVSINFLNTIAYSNVNTDYIYYPQGSISTSMNQNGMLPEIPVIQVRINRLTQDTIKIKSVSLRSKSKNIVWKCFIDLKLYENLMDFAETDAGSNVVTITTETPVEITGIYKNFHITVPINEFPENDLVVSVTFDRNDVEETLEIEKQKSFKLDRGELKIIKVDIV